MGASGKEEMEATATAFQISYWSHSRTLPSHISQNQSLVVLDSGQTNTQSVHR